MSHQNRIYIKQIEVGPMQNYMYILGDVHTKQAVLVDPAWEVDRVLKIAAKDGFEVKKALITHTHFDHVNGVDDFLNLTDGVCYVHKAEASYLKKGKGHIQPTSGGDKIKIGDLLIQFVHTPGHTPGSQCFLISEHLVSGDTLFINACGRCDLPGGDPEDMYRSLTQKLMKLDDNTILLPGHNYSEQPTSTIVQEKEQNPYLRCESLDRFLHLRMGV